MRCFIAAAVLLICSTSQAALINPLGGTWTDGTATADYTEVATGSESVQRYQMLLNVSESSHILSDIYVSTLGTSVTLRVTNSVDFYDGLGQVDGEFEFEVTEPGGMRLSFIGPSVFDTWLNDVPRQEWGTRMVEPGFYTLSFQLDEVAINQSKSGRVDYGQVPEPSAVWLLALGLPLWFKLSMN